MRVNFISLSLTSDYYCTESTLLIKFMVTEPIITVLIYRYNERTHTTRLRVMIISFWVFGVAYTGIVKLYQHVKGRTLHQFDYEARECYFDCSYHKTLLYYTNLTLSRVLPLLFNIIVYGLVIYVIRTRNIFKSKKSYEILVRALLICITFSMSWLPGEIVYGMGVKDKEILQITQFCFYINCLSDPLLYTCTSKLFYKFWNKLTSSTHRGTTRRNTRVTHPKYTQKLKHSKITSPCQSATPGQRNVANSKDDGCIVLGSPFCQDANRKHSLPNP